MQALPHLTPQASQVRTGKVHSQKSNYLPPEGPLLTCSLSLTHLELAVTWLNSTMPNQSPIIYVPQSYSTLHSSLLMYALLSALPDLASYEIVVVGDHAFSDVVLAHHHLRTLWTRLIACLA
jgi:hypothetical protein